MRKVAIKTNDMGKAGPGRALWLVVCVIASASILVPLLAYASKGSEVTISESEPPQSSLDPEINKLLQEGEKDRVFDFIIYMETKADLDMLDLPEGKSERRNFVVNELQNVATRSQAELLDLLESLTADGAVTSYRTLWIANAIQVTGRVSILPALSTQPRVERIVLDTPKLLLERDDQSLGPPPLDLTWGLVRVRARHVWDGLGIDGSGVTVAVMDTGVDWLHPALYENYRGFEVGSEPNHLANWFDAIDGTSAPFDPHGHGTHVAGTAVGRNGIGVAPSARWMAVRVLDENGYGTIGNVHAGFQWLMAPAGDPSFSPDIVNNSWGSENNLPDFIPDVAALKSAGIIPIFAAGNSGPGDGTIHTPAGYPDTFSVGASDDIDAVAWFSSRGPSVLTTDPKPSLVAPGTNILSAMSGGGYSFRNGTSMATPHVAGIFALLLSANAGLNESQITFILTSTALLVDLPVPSNTSGWGRIDAYAAVSGEVPVGVLTGQVLDSDIPVPSVTILLTTPAGSQLDFKTNQTGRYEVPLQPALYDIVVKEFGYETYELRQVAVTANQRTILDIDLSSRPKGFLSGSVIDSVTGNPVLSTVRVLGTPISVSSDDQGQYAVDLPEGTYDLLASSVGFRLGKATVSLTHDTRVNQDFTLVPAPRALLVDSGQWYYRSQVKYYLDALEEIEIAHDLITIRDPFEDVPTVETLSGYDVVIWSSPTDAPVQISAGEAISGYLSQGGNLLISGQNVGEFEGAILGSQSWWRHHLMAEHLGKMTPPISITGHASSVFSSTTLTLNGSGSANNQEATDYIRVRPGAFTLSAFRYQDGSLAGLQAGDCAPFEAVYLGFGLEGVSGAEERTQIISKSFHYFSQPDREIGARINPNTVNDIAVSGRRLTRTLEIINLSETLTDTYVLSIEESNWSASIITDSLILGPCQSGSSSFTVDVPLSLEPDSVEEFEITISSSNDPSYGVQIPVKLKTPSRILLVDDDRWYDREHVYFSALDANEFVYDYWEIGTSPVVRGSPPGYLLDEYDIVIWYTGYDWFAPLTDSEVKTLESYLNQGGRLFLSSQDYLFFHSDEFLTTFYLGVHSYRESVTPILALGDDSPGFLNVLTRPLELDYGPYQNFSDGLIPSEHGMASLWHDGGLAAGLANAGNGWRTVFWAIPFEVLPDKVRSDTMNRIVGWLSDLGDSTFEVDARVVPNVDVTDSIRTYTITLRVTDGTSKTGVWVTNTIPSELAVDPVSISGGAQYNPVTRDLTWKGMLGGGQEHVIHYQASLETNTHTGTQIDNSIEIFYDRHNLLFKRTSPIWVGTPDLSGSHLEPTPLVADVGGLITYQLEIVNSVVEAGLVTATFYIPSDLSPIPGSITSTEGTISTAGTKIVWSGWIEGSDHITVSYVVSTPLSSTKLRLPTLVALTDGESGLILLNRFVDLAPDVSFLPIMIKE